MHYSLKGKRVYVAGHRGMVGAAICRQLENEDCTILTATRAELNLVDQAAVGNWFQKEKPDAVFLAAAKVGGILANATYPADFLYENLMIESNIIHSAYEANVEKLVFLGSSCIYPKFSEIPIKETELLEGQLEPTNEWYAIAKIAGIKLCQAYRKQYGVDFVSGMPTNLYGIGDNFDLETSHVLPALIRKFDDAVQNGDDTAVIWGSGSPLREFMHCDDCASALVHVMKHYSDHEHINVGSEEEVSILELAQLIAKHAGFEGKIIKDTTKPDGTFRKLMDGSKLRALGWTPSIRLDDGVRDTVAYYRNKVRNNLTK